MTTIAELLVEIGVKVPDAKAAERKIDGLRRTTTKFGDKSKAELRGVRGAFRRLGSTVRTVSLKARASLTAFAAKFFNLKAAALATGVAITALAVGTFKFVGSQTASIDEVNKLSAALGISGEELQRLQFAAERSGVGQKKFNSAIVKLNANLLDISKGSGLLAREAFDDLGISIDQLQGKGPTEQLGIIGDALNNIDDEALRSALSARLFGAKAGPELATLLGEGTEGLNALTAAAAGVLSQEDLDRASAYQDALTDLKTEVTGVAREVAVELIPALITVVEGITDFIQENQDLIDQGLPVVLEGITVALEGVFEALDTVASAVNFVTENFGFLGDAASAVGLSFSGVASAAFAMIPGFNAAADAASGLVEVMTDLGIINSKISGKPFNAGRVGRQAGRTADRLARKQAREDRGAFVGPRQSFRGGASRGGAAKRGGGGGGGGAPKKPTIKPQKATATPGVTVDEAISALLVGDTQVLQESLKGLAQRTPSTRDIKPTVAIDFFNFEINQTITATDPRQAGQESAAAIRAEFRKATAQAGQALAGNVVR